MMKRRALVIGGSPLAIHSDSILPHGRNLFQRSHVVVKFNCQRWSLSISDSFRTDAPSIRKIRVDRLII